MACYLVRTSHRSVLPLCGSVQCILATLPSTQKSIVRAAPAGSPSTVSVNRVLETEAYVPCATTYVVSESKLHVQTPSTFVALAVGTAELQSAPVARHDSGTVPDWCSCDRALEVENAPLASNVWVRPVLVSVPIVFVPGHAPMSVKQPEATLHVPVRSPPHSSKRRQERSSGIAAVPAAPSLPVSTRAAPSVCCEQAATTPRRDASARVRVRGREHVMARE